jgi:hypothetical protein
MSEPSDLERVSAAVRLAREDTDRFLTLIGDRLGVLIPGLVRVRRRGVVNRRIEQIVVTLPDERLSLSRTATGLATSRAQMVRGIALTTEQLTVDAWMARLASAVAEHAATQTDARVALERLLTLD